MKNKTLVGFLIKTVVLYVLLTLPFGFLEKSYTKFYISVSKVCFTKIHDTGFVFFLPGKDDSNITLQVGNKAIRQEDGTFRASISEVNTRIRGYIPTALLFALLLATPFGWKRKIINLFWGISFITLLVMLKQWIHLIYIYSLNPYFQLYILTPDKKKTLDFCYENLITPSGPSLFIVMIIWFILAVPSGFFRAIITGEKTADH